MRLDGKSELMKMIIGLRMIAIACNMLPVILSIECYYVFMVILFCRNESHLILLAGLIRGLLMSIKHTIQSVALFLMLAAFTLSTERPLTPSIVFTSLLLLSTLRLGAVAYLIECILGIQESRVALFRIQVTFPSYFVYKICVGELREFCTCKFTCAIFVYQFTQ